MSTLELGPDDALYYEHNPPTSDNAYTFVFFNALTADTQAWEASIAPTLRSKSHGTLTYNLRGQTESPFSPDVKLTTDQVVADAVVLLNQLQPTRPVLVGLSIGGLFAARAWLDGIAAEALVLINTLRKPSIRLQWIGDALVRAAEVGGLDLFRDLFLPLLMNEDWQEANRPSFLSPNPSYVPLDASSGHYKLLSQAGRDADWDFPYEQLDLPVLVITGLQDHVFLVSDDVAELFVKLPQGQQASMPDAGHLIPNERPEELAQILLNYVKEL